LKKLNYKETKYQRGLASSKFKIKQFNKSNKMFVLNKKNLFYKSITCTVQTFWLAIKSSSVETQLKLNIVRD